MGKPKACGWRRATARYGEGEPLPQGLPAWNGSAVTTRAVLEAGPRDVARLRMRVVRNAALRIVDLLARIERGRPVRIADIADTGFLEGNLMVPRFVLDELQYIADSSDALKRARGRRGLDILNRMQKDTTRPLRITDMDVDEVREVDDKLIALAKRLKCPVLTNDYNLNRVAEIQGVTVLNVNELANAVRLVFLPGESMRIEIIQEGKEVGQGVGYLDDGTMIVVENGRRYINKNVEVAVTSVLQTAAGRMIFTKLKEDVESEYQAASR